MSVEWSERGVKGDALVGTGYFSLSDRDGHSSLFQLVIVQSETRRC